MSDSIGIAFVLFLLGIGIGYGLCVLRLRPAVADSHSTRLEVQPEQDLERQAELLAAVRDAVIVIGMNTRVVKWNVPAEKLYGFTREEAVGQIFQDLVRAEMTPSEQQEALQEVVKNGYWRGTAVHYTKAGKRIFVDATSSFVYDGQGKTVAMIGINRDITNQVDTEALFKNLFANNPLPMSVYDRKTLIYLDVNEAMVAKYGYSREEFLAMSITQIRPEAEITRLLEVVNAGEWKHRLKDGRIIDVEVTRNSLDYNGHDAALVVIQDITERKQIERALRESEERFRALLENGQDMISVVSADGTIRYATPSIERILGYRPEELIGMKSFDLAHPEDSRRSREVFLQTVQDGIGRYVDLRMKHKDGSWRMIELIGKPAFDMPAIQGVVLTGHDITLHKQAEETLRETGEKLGALIQAAPLAVVALDLDGNITLWNSAATRIFGWTEAEVLGRPNPIVPEDDYAEFVETNERVLHGELFEQLEVIRKRRDGMIVDVSLSTALLRDAGGRIAGTIAMLEDITPRRLAQRKLLQQNAYLAALHETTLALVNRLDTDSLLEAILNRAGALMGAPRGHIYLLEPEGQEMVLRLTVGVEKDFLPTRLRRGEGLSGYVWQTEQSLVVENYATSSHHFSGDKYDAARSVMAAPLRSGNHIVGVICLAQVMGRPAFSPEELAVFNQFAELASVALDNARLFMTGQQELAERKRAEQKLLHQNEYLIALHETAVALTNRLSVDDLLETILLRAGSLLDTPDGFLYLVDPILENLLLRVGVGFYHDYAGYRVEYGKGLVGRIWESGQLRAIDHYNEWAERLENTGFDQVYAIIGIPLKSEGRVVGVVGLARFKEGWVFSPEEVALLDRFAELASLALENARLYGAAQQELAERKRAEQQLLHQNEYLTALHETTLALVNRLESGDLLEAIISRAGALLGASDGFVYLVSPDQNEMIGHVGVGRSRKFLGKSIRRGEGLSGRVWESGSPLAVNDYAVWPHRNPDPDFDEVHALVSVPLHSGGQVLGALSLGYVEEGRSFGPDEIAILGQFAELASIVLDNASLYSSAQQELAERRRAEEDLRHLNAELEVHVQRRTAELQQRQAQLRAVLDAMGDGVLYSEQFEIRYTNQAMAELTGYRVEELIGQPNAIFKTDGATAEEAQFFYQNFAEPGVTWRGEQCWRCKDGTDFEVALTVRLLENADQSIAGAVTVVRDITAEKKLQAQKLEFIANASHELRTPLTNFKTRLYLMRRQPERIDEHMTVLERVTERMVRLVEDLLDVSRFERGVIPINLQDVVLQELIGDVAHTMQPEAQAKCLSLTTDLPAKPFHILGDPNRLTQVFVNLIVNAINYTLENGHVRVRLFEDDGTAVLQVQDTGIGIRPENLKRVFEPFFRANEGTARGTGLGLSISRQIVQLHKGTLNVESISGQGSTFIARLPLENPISEADASIGH